MGPTPPEPFVRRSLAFVRRLVHRGRGLRLAQTAASLAFLSLLATVPIFTIAVSLLGALPVLAQPRTVLLEFLAANLFLPSFSATLVRYLDQFADKVNELSLLGAAAFLVTAFSALRTIDRTLNQIWPDSRPRPWTGQLTVYWTFLTLGPLMLGISAAVHGMVVSEVLGATRPGAMLRGWLSVLPWLVGVGGLMLLYRIVPNARVRWREALIGASLAAAGLEALKHLLTLQVAKLPTYTVVYGAFAALPLFLIWLFALWLTVLTGALVAASLPDWRAPAVPDADDSPAVRFARATEVLRVLADALARGRATIAPDDCPAIAQSSPQVAERTAVLLTELGYLDRYWRLNGVAAWNGQAGLWAERWALRPEAAGMTLRPLFERVWHARQGSVAEPFDPGLVDRPVIRIGRSGGL